jgi:hypothetical protein
VLDVKGTLRFSECERLAWRWDIASGSITGSRTQCCQALEVGERLEALIQVNYQ